MVAFIISLDYVLLNINILILLLVITVIIPIIFWLIYLMILAMLIDDDIAIYCLRFVFIFTMTS
jgi:hypothetical protein